MRRTYRSLNGEALQSKLFSAEVATRDAELREHSFETDAGSATFFAAGTLFRDTLVGHIVEGSAANERTGRDIVVRYIDIRGHVLRIFNTQGGLGDGNIARWALVIDHQCNGVSASWDDVFEENTESRVFWHVNLANSSRFTILCDKLVEMNTRCVATTAFGRLRLNTAPNVLFTQSFAQTVSVPITYSSSGNGISDVRSNNIFIVGCTLNDDFPRSQMRLYYRVLYSDG